MISAAIFLIIIIALGAAYLLARESDSLKPTKRYGVIITAALIAILVIVIFVGYTFLTYLK